MLSLNSEDWKTFTSGYRNLYDVSVPLRLLASKMHPDNELLDELWENLYHQGDVGTASYAAVPQIYKIYKEKDWIDFHLPAWAAAVERARTQGQNPVIPVTMKDEYFASLREIALYCIENSSKINDRNFSKGLLFLVAILLGEKGVYDLLDSISIGEEEKVLEVYCNWVEHLPRESA